MIKALFETGKKLFGTQLDFRVRLFNILAFVGIFVSLIGGVAGTITGAGPINLVVCFLAAIFSVVMIRYSFVSGKYQLCYMITIVCVFLGAFPAIFFNAGGYRSGMPMFFVFAVLFTVFMLEGKKRIAMAVLELIVYASICIFAYQNPGRVIQLPGEKEILIDTIVCFILISATLGITLSLHFDLYKKRQKELETARLQVEEYLKMKSELFAAMSHEMRTPLTVMSSYAQFAVEQIRENGANEQTLADLTTISNEAMRLAEMADSTLKILINASKTGDTAGQKISSMDIGDLSLRLVRLLEPVASRKGMKLSALIRNNVPAVPGDADALTQLLWNLLQNAITHSEGKTIKLNVEPNAAAGASSEAAAGGLSGSAGVKITVSDDGLGIEPEILPLVFERGVSGKKGRSGLGLSICRDIARRHGGDITAMSLPGAGACITVILRGIVGG